MKFACKHAVISSHFSADSLEGGGNFAHMNRHDVFKRTCAVALKLCLQDQHTQHKINSMIRSNFLLRNQCRNVSSLNTFTDI